MCLYIYDAAIMLWAEIAILKIFGLMFKYVHSFLPIHGYSSLGEG